MSFSFEILKKKIVALVQWSSKFLARGTLKRPKMAANQK
jgi:hypothetical protein